jgi:UDP-N-acetylglucosamine 2-epimerase (non-hydrolysing)
LHLAGEQYLLVTIHRPENVDHPQRFSGMLAALDRVAVETGLRLVCPMHPRTRKMLDQFGLKTQGLEICDPLGFSDFLALEASARLIVTDSGGVQEEACVLGVRCVTLRENTERPETLLNDANLVAGVKPQEVFDGCRRQLAQSGSWAHPLGDGKTGHRLARHVKQHLAALTTSPD